MATIHYKCTACKREIELIENAQGLTVFAKCVITDGCRGNLYKIGRNADNLRESIPTYSTKLDNYSPRRTFFQFVQTISRLEWNITHNLGVEPSVVVFIEATDGTLSKINQDEYTTTAISNNKIKLTFSESYTGIVHCVARSSVPFIPETEPTVETLTQISYGGILSFAFPQYITQLKGTNEGYNPTYENPQPSPTPIVTLPIKLADGDRTTSDSLIRIEVEITRPNEQPVLCFEDLDQFIEFKSPWIGWDEIYIRKRRNYSVKTKKILEFRSFNGLATTDIPNGTLIRFLRIDYGTGRIQPISSRGLFVLLALSPFESIDKIKNQLVDVGEMIGAGIDYFVYNNGNLFVSETVVEKIYPNIEKVVRVEPIAPTPTPTNSITPTPTVTPTVTPSITVTVTPTVTPSASQDVQQISLAVGHDTTPFITIYNRSGDTFTKLANPADLPPAAGRTVAWNTNETSLVIGCDTSPFITIYNRSGDTFTKLTNPADLPPNSVRMVAWNHDSTSLAASHDTTPFVTIYNRSGDTFTKLANPTDLPPNLGNGCAWNSDGTSLAVAHNSTPFVTIYNRSGDTFTKLANPATLPTSHATGCTWNHDGLSLAVVNITTPFVTIYNRSGDIFTKLANPGTLPTGAADKAEWNFDGTSLAIAHTTSPRITIYNRSGDTFTKIANPATLPAGNAHDCTWNHDGTSLTVTHATTPFVTIYNRSGDTFTKIANPATLPASTGWGCAFNN